MSIPEWFKEEMKNTQSVYDELSLKYPKSIKYIVEEGAYIRKNFWGQNPDLLKMVDNLTDDEINLIVVSSQETLEFLWENKCP